MDDLYTYRWGWGLDESYFPAAAADLLATGRLPGRLYNRYGMGGYLLYRLHPRVGVFQDGRLQAYPQDFMADFNTRFSFETWPALLEEYDVNTALVHRPRQEVLFRREEWGIVNWDDAWVLLLRRTPSTAELLAELEYRTFLPGVDITAVTDDEVLGVMLREMERNQGERRIRSAVTENNRAVILMRLGRKEEAFELFLRAGEMGYPPAWVNHAAMAMEKGDRQAAIRSLEAALEIDEEFDNARKLLGKVREGAEGDGR
jgi:tetratricopeptide (TPR) repeat protein